MVDQKKKLTEKFSKAAITNNGRVHIVHSKDGWSVKREGSKRATVIKTTKASAVKAAKGIKSASRIIVHSKDGSIQTNMMNV
jgi:hypothetical protein